MASSLHRESDKANWSDRTMTLDEFQYANPLPEARSELVEGRMIVREPPKERHGFVTVRILRAIIRYLDSRYASERDAGVLLCNDVGILLQREPPTVRAADIAYYLPSRTPRSGEEYSTEVPDMVVEVRSPTDRPGYPRRKIGEWQRGGCTTVWVADAREKTLTVHGQRDVTTYADGDVFNGAPLFPGLDLHVAAIFL